MSLSPHWTRICCPWMRSRMLPLDWIGFSRSCFPSAWRYPRRTASLRPRPTGWPSALSSTATCSAFTWWFWPCMPGLCCCSGPVGASPDTAIRDRITFFKHCNWKHFLLMVLGLYLKWWFGMKKPKYVTMQREECRIPKTGRTMCIQNIFNSLSPSKKSFTLKDTLYDECQCCWAMLLKYIITTCVSLCSYYQSW